MAFFNLPFGVRVAGSDPIDGDRYLAVDIAARDALIGIGRAKEGQQVYVEATKILYVLKGATNLDWAEVGGSGGGTGDVVGPGAAVDEHIAIYDGITGKLIKDSGKTIAEIIGGGGTIPTDIIATVGAGDIDPGETIAAGSNLEDFINQIVAPVLSPSIGTMNSVIFNGVSTQTREIGEIISETGSAAYYTGIIKSLNPVADVPLTGPSTGSAFSGTGITNVGAINTPVVAGTNMWTVVESFSVGSAPYYKSDGTVDSSLDGQRGPGTVTDNSNIITGRYRYWYSVGTAPSSSVGVRSLTDKGFFPVGSFTMMIPINTPVLSFFLPATHGTVTVTYTESSNADVTGSFTETAMPVNDGGGTSVGYSKFETVIGGGGYPTAAHYVVTIS